MHVHTCTSVPHRYLLSCSPELCQEADRLMRITPSQMSSAEYLELACTVLHKHWPAGGQSKQHILYNHMTKEVQIVS